MPISVDWPNKVISIPKDYTQLVQTIPFEIRQLNIDLFRLDLKALEAIPEEGMGWEKTHRHNTTVTVGGVTLARVVEIINNYTITFEDGLYGVNLVGANSNIADVVNLNQVQIRSANSAGLTFSDQINAQSFTNNRVYVNNISGIAGTQFPRGTPTDPVNNITDAQTIATNNKLTSFQAVGQYVIDPAIDLSGASFFSDSPFTGIAVVQGNTAESIFVRRFYVTGAMFGQGSFEECSFENLTGIHGVFTNCGFQGTITFNNSLYNFGCGLIDCFSAVSGPTPVIFDLNNMPTDFQMRGWRGGVELRNISYDAGGGVGINLSVDTDSGTIFIDSSCTLGRLVVRGSAKVIDKSTLEEIHVSRTINGGFEVVVDTETERVWNYKRETVTP